MTFVMTRIRRVLSLSTLNKFTNSVKCLICYHSVCSFVVYGKNIQRICFMTMDTRMILYRCFLLLFNPSPDISFLDFFSILIYLKRASALQHAICITYHKDVHILLLECSKRYFLFFQFLTLHNCLHTEIPFHLKLPYLYRNRNTVGIAVRKQGKLAVVTES